MLKIGGTVSGNFTETKDQWIIRVDVPWNMELHLETNGLAVSMDAELQDGSRTRHFEPETNQGLKQPLDLNWKVLEGTWFLYVYSAEANTLGNFSLKLTKVEAATPVPEVTEEETVTTEPGTEIPAAEEETPAAEEEEPEATEPAADEEILSEEEPATGEETETPDGEETPADENTDEESAEQTDGDAAEEEAMTEEAEAGDTDGEETEAEETEGQDGEAELPEGENAEEETDGEPAEEELTDGEATEEGPDGEVTDEEVSDEGTDEEETSEEEIPGEETEEELAEEVPEELPVELVNGKVEKTVSLAAQGLKLIVRFAPDAGIPVNAEVTASLTTGGASYEQYLENTVESLDLEENQEIHSFYMVQLSIIADGVDYAGSGAYEVEILVDEPETDADHEVHTFRYVNDEPKPMETTGRAETTDGEEKISFKSVGV